MGERVKIKITSDCLLEVKLGNETVIMDDSEARELLEELIEKKENAKEWRNLWIQGIEVIAVA